MLANRIPATLSGHPKTRPKGRIFELRYLHHNAMQLYEILCISETDNVAILLYMIMLMRGLDITVR
jgi:hypothetical protein